MVDAAGVCGVVSHLHPAFGTDPAPRFGFTPSQPGDSFYVEAWGPWIVLALLWLAPLLAGLVLAVIAVKRRAGKSAWWAIAVHGLLLLSFTVPNIIERLLTL